MVIAGPDPERAPRVPSRLRLVRPRDVGTNLATSRRMGDPMKVDEDVYVVSMNLPEFRKEDVRVELRDEFVAIRAARRKPENASNGSGQRPEAISRSFRLPADADREHLEASFDDGTLTLRIHRREARGPRSVELR